MNVELFDQDYEDHAARDFVDWVQSKYSRPLFRYIEQEASRYHQQANVTTDNPLRDARDSQRALASEAAMLALLRKIDEEIVRIKNLII